MKPFIVAVNAISGGGKTTVAKALQKRLPNAKALYFDDRNYDADSDIHDVCQWIEEGADVHRFNLERLAADLHQLKKEKPDFIIMDYPFGYRHKLIAPSIHFSVFIDTPLDIAMARRLLRGDCQREPKHLLEDMKHYLEKGRKAYLHGIDTGRESADFIVDGSLPVDKIVAAICEKIECQRAQK